MSLAASVLTSGGDNSFNPTVATASFTPTANALVLFYLISRGGNGTTISNGDGLTWVNMVSDLSDSTDRRLNLWRGLTAGPSGGGITINNTNSNVLSWAVVQVTGCDTSGSNGSGAIAQGAFTASLGSTSSIDAPLGVNSQATGMILGFCSGRDETSTLAVGSGYTSLANISLQAATLLAQDITGVTQTSCAATMTFGGPNAMTMISLEVKVAGVATDTSPPQFRSIRGQGLGLR